MVETTVFVDVVVWGRQAETCGEYLSKGSPALIEGRLQLEQWQTESGEKRSRLRVRADRVQFLGRPKKSGEVGDAPMPEKKPALRPCSSVRRAHRTPIGPTGAAVTNPMMSPFRKNTVSMG